MDMDKLKSQIKSDEGFRDQIYLDHLGNKTVGYGHLVTNKDWFRDKKVGFRLRQEELDLLLAGDLAVARRDCGLLFNDFNDLPEEAKQVLCNMAFQLGRNRLGSFKKMIAAIDQRDFVLAATEMLDSVWAKKQTPGRAVRLAERMAVVSNVEET